MDIYQASTRHVTKIFHTRFPSIMALQRPRLSEEKIREIFEENKTATKQLNMYK
jgi:hypothetical protein